MLNRTPPHCRHRRLIAQPPFHLTSRTSFVACNKFAAIAALTVLTACASPPPEVEKPQLIPPPLDLVACVDTNVTPLPGAPGTAWNTQDTVGIIGDQRSDALAKDKCAHNWRSFYEDYRSKLSGGK